MVCAQHEKMTLELIPGLLMIFVVSTSSPHDPVAIEIFCEPEPSRCASIQLFRKRSFWRRTLPLVPQGHTADAAQPRHREECLVGENQLHPRWLVRRRAMVSTFRRICIGWRPFN